MLVTSSSAAVLSGAGLSAGLPAALPLGNDLRNEVVSVIHRAAAAEAPHLVGPTALGQVLRSRKLEVVLGRLNGVSHTQDALGCLECLRLRVPNEAHMFAALHLARGGTHVTVNLDRGIEQAYALLRSDAQLPDDAPEELVVGLDAWRDAAGSAPALRVAITRSDFERWQADGQPSSLLKVHGGLAETEPGLAEVVVTDTEELGALHPARLAAVEQLADAERLLIVGYSGADPDVYGPLLAAAAKTRTTWATKSLWESSPVYADCHERGIRIVTGDPEGLATTVLRRLLGDEVDVDALHWPAVDTGQRPWKATFNGWRERFERVHARQEIALSLAWMSADGGDLDRAVELLRCLLHRSGDSFVTLRLAEALYNRARGDDRSEAAGLYRQLLRARDASAHTRQISLLRLGGIARGRAMRAGGPIVVLDLTWALTAPLLVLALERIQRNPDLRAAAVGASGQTSLRAIELAALALPRRVWPVLSAAAHAAAGINDRASQATSNGNARALSASHRQLSLALGCLLGGRRPHEGLAEAVSELRERYRHADDLPGAGNCEATLAVLALADGDRARAERLLERALTLYARDGEYEPAPSGAALVDRVRRLAERLPA